jgi:hypothetical protein
VILQAERSQLQIPSAGSVHSLEAVLIMESRPSRFQPGPQVAWTQMYQVGHFHLNLCFQSTPTGGMLQGQIISLNRLKLAYTRITALNVIGSARLETEFGQLEANGTINANGDFEIVLDQPALYPLTLRLISQHGLDVSIADLGLY